MDRNRFSTKVAAIHDSMGCKHARISWYPEFLQSIDTVSVDLDTLLMDRPVRSPQRRAIILVLNILAPMQPMRYASLLEHVLRGLWETSSNSYKNLETRLLITDGRLLALMVCY